MNLIEAQIFTEKLEQLFSGFTRLSLTTADFNTIFVKPLSPADITSLSQCAEVSQKYLNLQDGDIVITNDPFSGGTLLSSPTLVLGIGTRNVKGNTPAEYLVTSRLTLKPRVGAFKTIDDEGLRIPPSPYYMRGEVNVPIVQALKAHPLVSEQFMTKVEEEAKKLLALRDKMKALLNKNEIDLSRPTLKDYFSTMEACFERQLDDVGEGNASVEFDLSPFESIKLKAEHHNGRFTFDYSGTSTGEKIFICDSSVIGATIHAVVSMLGVTLPYCTGIFSRFDVRTPRGTLVNASFPRPLFLGHTDGVNAIGVVVRKALGLIHKKQLCADSGLSNCNYELKFRDGKTFVDSLALGAGASAKSYGISGLRRSLFVRGNASIENWEKEFPLQVISTSYRANSGGDGKNSGGMGTARSLRLLEEATLSWTHIHTPHQPMGADGGRSALSVELVIQRATGQRDVLPHSGTVPLQKGDIVTAMSPGGGGYGLERT